MCVCVCGGGGGMKLSLKLVGSWIPVGSSGGDVAAVATIMNALA